MNAHLTDPDPFCLADRRAVVTGASSGIGRAIALELAAAGAHVLVHGHRHGPAAMAVAEAIRAQGRQAEVLLADVADPHGRTELLDHAWRWAGGQVDIWVNNAGADVLTGPTAEWSFDAKLARLWEVDVVATIDLSRQAGRRMRPAAGPGPMPVILNMGWDQAEVGMAGDSGEMFSCVKGAIMAFTRSLAHSLAPHVRVHCLAPGWIRTAWATTASAYWQDRARRETLLDRWGSPEDVARVARFLASPAAAFLTGQVVPVNGGFRGSAGGHAEHEDAE